MLTIVYDLLRDDGFLHLMNEVPKSLYIKGKALQT